MQEMGILELGFSDRFSCWDTANKRPSHSCLLGASMIRRSTASVRQLMLVLMHPRDDDEEEEEEEEKREEEKKRRARCQKVASQFIPRRRSEIFLGSLFPRLIV